MSSYDATLLSRASSLSATTSMDLAAYLEEYSEYDRVYSEDKPQVAEETKPAKEFELIVPKEMEKPGVVTFEECEKYKVVEFGLPGTLQYRALLLNSKDIEVSLWHDIPLHSCDHYLHFVCKTPKGSWVEYETAQSEPFNPLKIKSWVERPAHFSENALFNYGMLPQTWSDPHDLFNGHSGDGRPLEIIDISSRVSHTGEVYLVKPLAAFAVIDMGAHVSWKIIAIAVADENASLLNEPSDIEENYPKLLNDIREWLRTCHSVDPSCKGKTYGLNETAAGLKSANQIIAEAHKAWNQSNVLRTPKEPWNLLLPRPISPSIYETMWKKHTAAESTSRIPLSDSIKGSTSRYERAWIDTYSPKWNEGLFGLASPPVKFACTIMSFSQKQALKTSKAEQWRNKFFEALDRQEDNPKITFSSALMNYTRKNILLNPNNAPSSLMERRRSQSSEKVLSLNKGIAVVDEPLYNHRRNKSLSRLGQLSVNGIKEDVNVKLTSPRPSAPTVPKSPRPTLKPGHKPQVTTTKNLLERIQESQLKLVCQESAC